MGRWQAGAFRIGTVRGIPIRVHVTFLLVLPFLAFGFGRAFRTAAQLADVPSARLVGGPWLWGLAVALALFASVLLHELAHSLYALRKGGRVRDITLLMIGGVSQLSTPPREPRHEAVMALVGPLVSLALGALLYGLHASASEASFNLRFALFYLGSLNLFLGAFNLLPAFPMDGGRILRALLVGRLGLVRATQVAARVGKAFAIVFGLWGFVSFNVLLMLIAFFVYVGADAEAHTAMAKALLGDLRVRDVMNTQAVTVSPTEDAAQALRLMSERDLSLLAVAEDGHLVGTISRDDILRSLDRRTDEAPRPDR